MGGGFVHGRFAERARFVLGIAGELNDIDERTAKLGVFGFDAPGGGLDGTLRSDDSSEDEDGEEEGSMPTR